MRRKARKETEGRGLCQRGERAGAELELEEEADTVGDGMWGMGCEDLSIDTRGDLRPPYSLCRCHSSISSGSR